MRLDLTRSCCLSLLQTAAVTSFVREHAVQRSDTLQMLAVRHGVTVPCLKRLNNLMSDHALHSRTQLFIPGAACGTVWTQHTAGTHHAGSRQYAKQYACRSPLQFNAPCRRSR